MHVSDTVTVGGPSSPAFQSTHWSVVMAASGEDGDASRDALAFLCARYWRPLYAFVEHRGYTVEEAQDLTQEFFSRLLAGNGLSGADPERGRFRTYLLGAFKHFLADEWDRATAAKRGGQAVRASLEAVCGERWYGPEPSTKVTPETLFEQSFATSLLAHGMDLLRAEYEGMGKLDVFERLKGFLPGEPGQKHYREVAEELGITEASVKVAVHRLRRRYRDLVRGEVACLVGTPEDVDDELGHLLRVLSE